MNEHEDCKVADFGVARLMDTTSIMTAETGTYRWMAPEVRRRAPPAAARTAPAACRTAPAPFGRLLPDDSAWPQPGFRSGKAECPERRWKPRLQC